MSKTYDVTILGGGIVGLATAYQILKQNPGTKLVLLEKEEQLAAHQTGHNSGVIHSGLYYKPGSLKAKNCIHGYSLLLDFLEEEEIPFDKCGKVVVATDKNQLAQLEILHDRGLANGLEGLRYLEPDELKDVEPHVSGVRAIYVPQTGIVDYKQVGYRYAEKIEELGGEIRTGWKVEGLAQKNGAELIRCRQGAVDTKTYINCTGLYSDKIASKAIADLDTKIIPFRGEYYKLKPTSKHLVKNLIYPVPDPNFPFLGVHFTRMINGDVEAGPNAVLAFRREGYTKRHIHLGELAESLMWPGFQKVAKKYWKTGMGEMWRSFSKSAFTKALQALIPEITASDLEVAPAGVRAQACDRTGGLLDDFKIHEARNAIHVLNAPSPAATSSLSIGETVAKTWSERNK